MGAAGADEKGIKADMLQPPPSEEQAADGTRGNGDNITHAPTPRKEGVNGNMFDEKKAYQAQEEEGHQFFDDGREIDLLHYIHSHPAISQIRGNPHKLLATIDEYGRTRKYLMNVGADKGRIVTSLIAAVKPRTMVELGGYVGYSALLFGDAVRRAGGTRYLSLERNPEFAAVIMALVDLAGLSDVVRVVVGASAESIQRLHAEGVLQRIDLLFLDHYKPAYTTDLKLCETLGLIAPGSVLAADNVIKPGNPPYLEYVRSSVREKRERAGTGREGKGAAAAAAAADGDDAAGFEERWRSQYKERVGEERLSVEEVGNPDLVYESTLVDSFEPTGVPDGIEISRCVGVEPH